jgi:hypothetical protein
VQFDEGVYAQDVPVDLLIDERKEDDETFKVVLSNPSGGTIWPGKGEATGTIFDDDAGQYASRVP